MRDSAEGGALVELGGAPAELNEVAAREWDRLVAELEPRRVLTDLDRNALAAYCAAYALWSDATDSLRRFGPMLKSPSGYPVQSPYVAIASRQTAIMMRIAGELGLTPTSRGKLSGAASDVDLFGDPVAENHGRRGRPQHVATRENRDKVVMGLALGWSNERLASALSITVPTLRKAYRRELKARDEQRDRLDAAYAMHLWNEVQAGNVGAMRLWAGYVERNDAMLYGQVKHPRDPGGKPKEPPLGKKEQALRDAHAPDTGSTLGELMARRQAARLQ